jgi:glycosyltransferase involved in cell wall biosynthesis
MRVLMLHPHDVRYSPWTIRIVKLAEALAQAGYQVRVACVEHKRAGEPDFPKIREFPDGPVEYALLRSRDKQTHKNISQVVSLAQDVDLIHFQKCFPSTFIPALWAAWKWDIPLHYDWDDHEAGILREVHGLPPGFTAQARFFEQRIPHYVDTVSVASDGLWELCRNLGFPESRMRKVPVGADLSAFDPGRTGETVRLSPPLEIRDRPLVAYIGQLEGAAYASLFVQACAQLADEFPEAVWMVVGGGGTLERLEELAYQLNLSHRVVFTDYLPASKIPDILAAVDIAVACFSDEPFVRCKSPLKVAEYLAAGKAMVASRVGEVPWMVDNAAILVEPGSVDALAAGIRELLRNPEARSDLSRKARRRAEGVVNWSVSALKLQEAYQIALGKRSGMDGRD